MTDSCVRGWKRPGIAVMLILMAMFTGCAEASSEINAPNAWETKTVDRAFARRAEAALKIAPTPEPGWRIGLVMSERTKDGWAITALTTDGMVFIEEGWGDAKGCDDNWWGTHELELLLDPGDLFMWAGDSRTAHRVCKGDLRVLRKAAA